MRTGINSNYIYSDLTHEIIGAAYEVQNNIGPGRPEKIYQKLMAIEFNNRGIRFKSQVKVDLVYKGIKATSRYLDFVVEGDNGEVIVELKIGAYIQKSFYEQTYEYLVSSGIKLALIILFSTERVKVRRVVNLVPRL